LAIGSNIVPRKQYIVDCLVAIKKDFPFGFITSSLFLTDPFSKVSQPSYYNCCVGFRSAIAPRELLTYCGALEKKLGRTRSDQRWQSRTIDIDILLMGDLQLNEPDLIIPHYDLVNRDFFLLPLLELDPMLVNPVSGIRLDRIFKEISQEKRTNPLQLFKLDV
jgi:2-amino-4-hydroxy-6-hydroxymethyldihydropteridine diphosphokinase